MTNSNNSPGLRERPLLHNVLDAADRLGISKWTLYELMHQGLLPSVKIQSRRFIADVDLEAYVERLRIEAGDRHGL
ncbi:MAG: Helix-turn-helix domain [Rhodoglobus sp.]|nr:Helix-turn-helix domain [Rhodoglobus sp.]